MCNVVLVKTNRTEFANIFAAVRKTAAARVCYLLAAHGALVAGGFNNLYNIGVLFIAAHCKLNAV